MPIANTNCVGEQGIEFVCNVVSPEDIVAIPETPLVVVSGYAGGAIHYISSRDLSRLQVFPVDEPQIRHDTANYAACPGPPDPQEADEFSAHGLNIRRVDDGRYLLYVVHHGFRESIEIFEIDTKHGAGRAGSAAPGFAWIGCIAAPEGVTMNSVSPLPGGGLVVTVPTMPPELFPADRADSESYGIVWEWDHMGGWTIVPGSESSGPNGIEASRDGSWLYVNLWSGGQLMRLSRGQAAAVRDVYDLPFQPDNIRWQADGSLLAAGHSAATFDRIRQCLRSFCEDMSSHVARVDLDTMEIEEIVRFPANKSFFTSTSALQLNGEIWIGSMRGERIARWGIPQSAS